MQLLNANVYRQPMEIDEDMIGELFICKTCGDELSEFWFTHRIMRNGNVHRALSCRKCENLRDRTRRKENAKFIPQKMSTEDSIIGALSQSSMSCADLCVAVEKSRKTVDRALAWLIKEGVVEQRGFTSMKSHGKIKQYRLTAKNTTTPALPAERNAA